MDIINYILKNFIYRLEKPVSTVGFKAYPTLRDSALHSPEDWLEGKRNDDNAEGYWRINDKLYDFTNFIDKHPGGKDWIRLTQGTDITEAFEAHHISTAPEKELPEYFISKTKTPRNSPFIFEEDGFYKTLKTRVRKELPKISVRSQVMSKLIADCLLLTFLATAYLSIFNQSYIIGAISGTLLTLLCIASHNFFHQKDNLRMYYFDLTMMSSRGFRITHALSHHIYTNTTYDMEITALEPFLQYMPIKKNLFVRFATWGYSPIVYALLYFGYYIRILTQCAISKQLPRFENILIWLVMLVLYITTGQSILTTTKFYIFIQVFSSLTFGLIGLNAGHHHPEVFHDGDEIQDSGKIDWGIYQVTTAMDRLETRGSHFWGIVSFGDHVLHHLFPALDHGVLLHLYPIVEEVCLEYGVQLKKAPALEVLFGQFMQLAKVPKKG